MYPKPFFGSSCAYLLAVALICFGTLALAQPTFGATPRGGAQADLIISKSGDESVPRGRNITYNIVVGNDGPDTAAGVVVTDPLPAHTTFVNAIVSQGTVMFAKVILLPPTSAALLLLSPHY